ncbi:MAG: hypothetical protein Q4A43_02595 [Coriobacteriia bacterium]|nr:hypothetical protein [Coriobacteriia bacterium]
MADRTEGVRIGPISLATLIAILLVGVLALLCVTTANAAQTMAQRQASATTETYALDSCGQKMLASISEELSSSSSLKATASKLSSIAEKAKKDVGEESLTIKTSSDSKSLSFTIAAQNGKKLDAKVSQKNGALSVDQWKLTSQQQDAEETLWSGSVDND